MAEEKPAATDEKKGLGSVLKENLVSSLSDAKGAVEHSLNKSDHSFWDNFTTALLNKVLGMEQFRRHLADKLDAPEILKLKSADIDELIRKSRPTEGWGGALGDVVATAPLLAVPGGPVAQGLLQGGAAAMSEPVRGEGDYFGRKGVQLTTGLATGGAGGILGRYLGAPYRRNPDRFNREVLSAAAPPGARKITAVGHEGVKQLETAWDTAYKAVEPRLVVHGDNDLLNDLVDVLQAMPGRGATTEEMRSVAAIIDGQVLNPIVTGGNTLTGEAVNNIQSSLRKIAESKSGIAEEVYAVRDKFLSAAERAAPDAAKELSGLRQKYSAMLAVRKAAAKATTDDGIFTPDQLASATAIVDRQGAAVGEAPFQPEISAARKARVGKLSPLSETFSGFPILGPVLRQAERNRAVQVAGRTVEAGLTAATPPAVGATVRDRPMPEQLPNTGTGMGAFEPTNEPNPDLEQRLNDFFGPEGGTAAPRMPGAGSLEQRLDDFFGPAEQQSMTPLREDRRFTSALRPMSNRLASLGVSHAGIAGILSNAAHESGGDPGAVGDGGNASGLLQWNGPRQQALIAFAQGRKGSEYDPNIQADFLIKELRSPEYAPLLARLRTSRDPQQAAMDFQTTFERPKVIDPERGRTAHAAARWLTQNQPIALPSGRGRDIG